MEGKDEAAGKDELLWDEEARNELVGDDEVAGECKEEVGEDNEGGRR